MYVENYSAMPSWVRFFYLFISIALLSMSYKEDLSFTTIIILYTPLMFEYHTLAKSGEKGFRKKVFKVESVVSKVILGIAVLGKFDIFMFENNRIVVNTLYDFIGGRGISISLFWNIIAVSCIVGAALDWVLIPKPTRQPAII